MASLWLVRVYIAQQIPAILFLYAKRRQELYRFQYFAQQQE